METDTSIKIPPKGLAILALIGPGLVWSSEMVGSGEVILTTRVGSILGNGVMWALLIGIVLKFWIGISGARYTVCTGEGMIDMFARIPGPKNWVVWIVLVVQFISAGIAMGSLASAAGVFINSILPVTPFFGGWLISIFAFMIAWSGGFKILKTVMSLFILIMIVGVLYVTVKIFPGFSEIVTGLTVKIPAVPEWAISKAGVNPNPWREILPLMGWAAGGFASQVWYSYWVLGAGYGAANGRSYGVPADVSRLKQMNTEDAVKIKGWCRVVYTDAGLAMVISIVLTLCFLIAGAVVLRPNQLAPQGPQVGIELSQIFSSQWGDVGGFLFLLTGAAAMTGTLTAQMAGWPRLLADALRICIPKFQEKLSWKTQLRSILVFFFITNIVIVFTLGFKPVFLVQLGAIFDGLLLTPLQALWVAVGLYYVFPRMLSPQAHTILKPHWIFAAGLILAFLVFGYFCAFQIPYSF